MYSYVFGVAEFDSDGVHFKHLFHFKLLVKSLRPNEPEPRYGAVKLYISNFVTDIFTKTSNQRILARDGPDTSLSFWSEGKASSLHFELESATTVNRNLFMLKRGNISMFGWHAIC